MSLFLHGWTPAEAVAQAVAGEHQGHVWLGSQLEGWVYAGGAVIAVEGFRNRIRYVPKVGKLANGKG